MNLSGVGRNFVWITVKTIISLLGSAALVGYSVRVLGATLYGSVATIGAWIGVLSIMGAALRYAVVRSAAAPTGSDAATDAETAGRATITASHSAFASGALVMVLVGIAFGWSVPADLGLHGAPLVHVYLATAFYVIGGAGIVATSAFAGLLLARESFGLIGLITLGSFALQAVLTVVLIRPLNVIGLGLAAMAAGLVQGAASYYFGHRQARWLPLWPRRFDLRTLVPVAKYAGAVVVLWLASLVEASSDPFVIGAVRGGDAVTIFRIGSMVPTSVVGLLYFGYGVVFPRLARTSSLVEQEEGVAWMGRVIGCLSGLAFGALVVLAGDAVRIFLGYANREAVEVLVICSCALCVDVAFHGAEQVLLARGQHAVLARYMVFDLVVNLAATVVGVILFGPVGSAIALAVTIGTRDLIAFPLIMRGRWHSPAGRFVWRNGVLQSLGAGLLVVGLGYPLVHTTRGLPLHFVCVTALAVAILAAFTVVIGPTQRRRLVSVMGRETGVQPLAVQRLQPESAGGSNLR